MPDLVSILIPAYNAARWIRQTLESALGQTWPKCEVIVVDDESSDDTLRLARAYESASVKVVAQPHGGASVARNTALSFAQGGYIQWLDADDLLAPDKITNQLDGADRGLDSLTLLSGAYGTFYYSRQRARFRPSALWRDLAPVDWLVTKFMEGAWMHPAVFLVSRKLSDAGGPWNSALSLDDDGEYYARIVAASERVRFVEDARSYYRIGNFSSLSTGVSTTACRSLLTSQMSSIGHLLSLEDSERTRRACVRYLQTWFGLYYPEMDTLVDEAVSRARLLGGELAPPELSWKYALIQTLCGWKTAKKWRRTAPKLKVLGLRTVDRMLNTVDTRLDMARAAHCGAPANGATGAVGNGVAGTLGVAHGSSADLHGSTSPTMNGSRG